MPEFSIFLIAVISLTLFAIYMLMDYRYPNFTRKYQSILEWVFIVIGIVSHIITWKVLLEPENQTILNMSVGIVGSYFLLHVLFKIQDDFHPYQDNGIAMSLGLSSLIGFIVASYKTYITLDGQLDIPWQKDLIDLVPLLFITLCIGGWAANAKNKTLGQVISILLFLILVFFLFRKTFSMSYQHISFSLTGVVLVVTAGYLFFLLKKRKRKIYGSIEIIFSIYTAYFTISDKLKVNGLSLAGVKESIINRPLSGLEYFQLFGAIYIFIRGMDNLGEAKKTQSRSKLFYRSLETDFVKADLLHVIGIDRSYKDKDGNSYVHLAAKLNNLQMLQFLIGKDMPYGMKNNNKQTPRELAKELGHKDIVQELDKAETEANK